ncbi:hypothetical protein GC163_22315 [bacterium]|nr:hypothetical protein [bacterium]
MSRSFWLTIGILVTCYVSPACASPLYLKVYQNTFRNLRQPTKCSICHQSDKPDKHERLNDYGLKVHEKLGQKRTNDAEAIRHALEEIGPAD